MKILGKTELEETKKREEKGLVVDFRKEIKKRLISLCSSKEDDFDEGLKNTFNFWMMTLSKEFNALRGASSIAKLIYNSHQLKRDLEWAISFEPKIRQSKVIIEPICISSPFSNKKAFSVLLGVQIDSSKEVLSRRGIKKAVEDCQSEYELLNTQYLFHQQNSIIHIYYLELEPFQGPYSGNGNPFFNKSRFLREIESRIQPIVPPLFMHRNEEELFRNLLILRREITRVTDIPQVFVIYDHHNACEITFNILLVRVLRKESLLVSEILSPFLQEAKLIEGQTYSLGDFEEDHFLQGDIFQLTLKDHSKFQRKNFSIDFYLARQEIVFLLEQGFGVIRDYNGGMLLKQSERLLELKQGFPEFSLTHYEFIENYFYSLRPIEKQATLSFAHHEMLLSLFIELYLNGQHNYLVELEKDHLYVVVKYQQYEFFPELKQLVREHSRLYSKKVLSNWSQGSYQFGGFFFEGSSGDLQKLNEIISRALFLLNQERNTKSKTLRFNNEYVELELDPRVGGTNESMAVNKLLFDGLTRMEEGQVNLACAASYQVTPDQCRYTFKLRKLFWSNGSLLLAKDFEYSWKKVLSPDFNTRFAYLFYGIKNAKDAKKGLCLISEVRVNAIDDETLAVELAYPDPFFLELLSLSLFSPVSLAIDEENPSWSQLKSQGFISNGPFRLKSPRPFYEYELEPNPYYWNKDRIFLEGISISKMSTKKAIRMFQNNELDWIGSPFSIPETVSSVGNKEEVYLESSKNTWYCFNLEKFPWNNKYIRKAVFYAIDREKIIKEIRGKFTPAYSPVSLEQSYFNPFLYKTMECPKKAVHFFNQGLEELDLSLEEFPIITIIYPEVDIFIQVSQIIKNQIEKTLGIQCSLVGLGYQELFNRITAGDYQVGAMRWISWIRDPLYTLSIFQDRHEKMNFINLKNPSYNELIRNAQREKEQKTRDKLLMQAERILIEEFGVLSLFYGNDVVLKKPHVHLPFYHPSGIVDFSYAKLLENIPEDH